MKRMYLILIVVLSLCVAFPVLGQPTFDPKPKTKVEAKAPASAPAAKPDAKVEVPAGEAKKNDEKPTATEKEEGMGYGAVAINHAIKLGFTLLSLLLSGLVIVLLRKFGFEAQTSKVNEVLKKAKGFAEQWAIKKAKVDGEAKPGGPAKMDKAAIFAIDLAKEYKLPNKAKEWWMDQLESWLGIENGS